MEFTEEELKLMKKLGITSSAPTIFKIIKAETHCKLCKTSTTQFIKMNKLVDGTWVQESEISSNKDIPDNLEAFKTSVAVCWSCEKTLMQVDKLELVRMLINFYSI